MILWGVAFAAAVLLCFVANLHYNDVFDDQNQADATATMRIISSAIVLTVTMVCVCVGLWSKLRLPRVHKRQVLILTSLCILLSIVAIYRLSVMHYRIDSWRGPNPLNSPSAKAIFYTFHILPEWLVTVVLLSVNVRKTFGTGAFGDIPWEDAMPFEKEKRLAKQTAIEERKKRISMENIKKGEADLVEEKGRVRTNLSRCKGTVVHLRLIRSRT